MKINKKAAIGSTLTWIVATFIIVFILALYFVFLGVIYGKDKVSSGIPGDMTVGYSSFKLANVEKLIEFLQSDAGKGISVYDYLSNADITDEEKIKFFKENGRTFLWKTFPGGTEDNPDYTTWVRLYSIDEKIEQIWKLISDYEAKQVYWGHQTTDLCIPSERNTATIPLALNKKIVLCWQKHSYAK